MSVDKATYSSMETSTASDWAIYRAKIPATLARMPDRLTQLLQDLATVDDGAPINGCDHSLQSATLAYKDDADDETVFMALFHDIGTLVSQSNHSEVSAAILKPYLSERGHWIIKHHGIFQGYYYFHHFDQDRNARDSYKDNPYYDACAEWCDRYDQRAFSSTYPSKSLDFFRPLIKRILLQENH